ncbi:hypothetical protein [Brevibacillus parabrevis]|uniref:hypothetical protein n=1 Tax=Brevibacillus parabrevis TaxID=54914 RepID=UPI00285321E0|nr:hypothetical protein [Brevibacillus parabrevis]MDR4997864.1 hypothetical protein [Brevibacillus parabrevis]
MVPQFKLNKLRIDGFEVDAPVGLSELLNTAGAWGPRGNVDQLNKKTERQNGRLVTTVFLIESSKGESCEM